MLKRLAILFLICCASVTAQGIRFSGTVTQQTTINGVPTVTIPANPSIKFCLHPANAVPCTNIATTYTDQTLATPCTGGNQIVRDGTNTCVASPDAQDNWGVWYAPNTLGYDYTITLPGGINLGPFNVLSQTTTIGSITISGSLTVSGAATFTGTPMITATNAGVFTNTQMNEYVTSSLNSCSPATQYVNTFDYSVFSTDAIAGCGVVPGSATAFEFHGVAGYAENQAAPSGTGAIGVYGKASNTGQVNGRAWGGAFYVSDHNVASNGLYGVEIDSNANNVNTQLHGLLLTGFWKTQPTASFALEVAQPQQGVGCSTCSWPTGIRFDTAATLAPDFINANSAALMLFPLASGVSQNSQGVVFIANKAGSGTTVGGLQLLANGQLNLVGGNGLNQGAISTSTASSLVPASPTSVGLTGDAGAGASGINYGVIGVARAPTGVTNAYGGWFKSTAQTLATAEVGVHAEVTDATGNAAEFALAGTVKSQIDGNGVFKPQTAGAAVIGTTALPVGTIQIGTAATNNFAFTPAATAAARTVNLNDTNGVASVAIPWFGSAGTAGYQTKRVVSCTTGAAAASTCTTTVTWTTAFPDANYTAVCMIDGPTGVPYVLGSQSKAGASIVVSIANLTAVAASGTLNCKAQHD